MDWRTILYTSTKLLNLASSAEERFRDAFERLKLGVPKVLPKGSHVSQNNVAKEAECDPSALRKSRFPLLVIAIQEWVEANKGEALPSKRQRLLKQRRKNRDAKETTANIKKQRDAAVGLLADADLRIVQLAEKVADLETELEELRPSANVLNLTK